MDIINTPRVKAIRAHGVLEEEGQQNGADHGDGEMSKRNARERRGATADENFLWPNGIIPYVFHQFLGKLTFT